MPPSIIAGDNTDIAEGMAHARAGDVRRAKLVSIIVILDRKARARRHRDLAAKLLTDGERVEIPELQRCGLGIATSHLRLAEDKAVFTRREAS